MAFLDVYYFIRMNRTTLRYVRKGFALVDVRDAVDYSAMRLHWYTEYQKRYTKKKVRNRPDYHVALVEAETHGTAGSARLGTQRQGNEGAKCFAPSG